MLLTAEQIANYTHAEILVPAANAAEESCGVTWDSREVAPGFTYVALPGERVDGHSFIEASIDAGARVVVAMTRPADAVLDHARAAGAAVLLVESTAQAFTDLAAGWRSHLQGTVVALTGSTGKTTTKNLVRDVLATTFSVVATKGNQNNELGVPRTLLEASADTECVVVEMGMRGMHQLEELCEFVRPDMALVTNTGECHIELLGSRENIARAKTEAVTALPDNAGKAFLNATGEYTADMISWSRASERGIEVTLFDGSGAWSEADHGALDGLPCVYATDIAMDAEGKPAFNLHLNGEVLPCALALRGLHNVSNACSAAALAAACGVAPKSIVAGLQASLAETGRQEVLQSPAGITVINDAYNANPDSMKASLALFSAMQVAGSRYAVLGDMGELGDFSKECHEEVGTFAAGANLDVLVCIGSLSHYIAEAARAAGMPADRIIETLQREETLEYLKSNCTQGDAVLVKASHSMELERIVEGLMK